MKKNPLYHIIYKACALCLTALLLATPAAAQRMGSLGHRATSCRPVGGDIVLRTTLVLDSLRLKSNRQVVITPVLEGTDGQLATFRPVMVNGRRQHIWYQRNGSKRYAGATEVRRAKGKGQTVDYLDALPYEPWMDGATLRLATDTCGCGDLLAGAPGEGRLLSFHHIAVRIYPADPTANLNAACVALERRELDRAQAYLAKAGNSPQAQHARGVLALLQGHYAQAEPLLTEAQKAGIAEADVNLEILSQLRDQNLD